MDYPKIRISAYNSTNAYLFLLVLREHMSSYFTYSIVCRDVLYSGLGKVEKTMYEYKIFNLPVIKAKYALVGLYAYICSRVPGEYTISQALL